MQTTTRDFESDGRKTGRLLIVEDDPNFGSVLADYLSLNQFEVELARDGKEGWEAWQKGQFDLALLDVMMPEIDGFGLARMIKERDPDFPIVFLTAKGLKEDVLQGYRIGADDYLVKPFDSEVLLHKIKALLQRTQKTEEWPVEFVFGAFRYNPKLRILNGPGGEQQLSPKEGELLALLCANLGDLVRRSDALRRIWKEDNYFTGRSMDVYVAKLRKYLREDPRIEIANVHSEGFRLIART
jgi:DNA-binding response OmpR family regulator